MEKYRPYMKNSIFERKFLIAVLAAAVLAAVAVFNDLLEIFRAKELLEYGYHGSLTDKACRSHVYRIALPVICMLPCSFSCVDEVKSGFIKAYLPRAGYKNYMLGKIFACILSGGLVPVCGAWLFYGLSALVLTPLQAALAEGQTAEEDLAKLLTLCGLLFLNGALWAMAGMAAGMMGGNRYMACAAPFILYYLLVILCERYLPGIYVLYPAVWLGPAEGWPFKETGLALWLAELVMLFSLLFARSAERRLRSL